MTGVTFGFAILKPAEPETFPGFTDYLPKYYSLSATAATASIRKA